MKVAILGMLVGLAGFLLIGFTVSWWGAIGVYVMLWGNNVNIPAMVRVDKTRTTAGLFDTLGRLTEADEKAQEWELLK